MLRLARQHRSVRVVSDQWGNPTSSLDLADGLLAIAASLDGSRFGTYHLAGTGDANWSGLARHVLDTSRAIGGPFAEVVDIPTAAYPARARRPASSRLCTDKAERAFGIRLPAWQSSADAVVARLLNDHRHG